jgi:hypothetical protein
LDGPVGYPMPAMRFREELDYRIGEGWPKMRGDFGEIGKPLESGWGDLETKDISDRLKWIGWRIPDWTIAIFHAATQ